MNPDTLLTLYLALWMGVLGAVLGSFFDCAAARRAAGAGWIPRGRSRCDACGCALSARDLIPVVSFLLCRGKCRHCGTKIPADCLWAELAGAAAFAGLAVRFGPSPVLFMWLILAAVLLLISLYDARTREIPNGALLFAAAVRAAFLFLLAEPLPQTLFDMALGALAVPGALLLLSLAMDKVLGRERLGGGDIKLLFVLGLYLGWAEMLLLLLAACILGILWALRPGKKNAAIPFAPFLSAAAILVTIFGSGLVEWYLGLL